VKLAELETHIRDERIKGSLSFEKLAEQARVEPLSAVERAGKSPSVLILDQIATELGTSIARLLAPESRGRVIVLRADEQDRALPPAPQ
jgi:transcriptional regulator with XRE-family HTH domain